MICVNATAVVAHNRQNRMVMSVFTLQKYCKNGNLQGEKKLLLGGKSLKMVYPRWRNYAVSTKKETSFFVLRPTFRNFVAQKRDS